MRVDSYLACHGFPCIDVNHQGYRIPSVDLDPASVRLVMISEASSLEPADDYYGSGDALFKRTTLQAFQDAGAAVSTFGDILAMGIYITHAVKCAKTAYAIQTQTVDTCSRILEQELALFPNVQVYLLMGDVAIKSVNTIAKRSGEPRVIPAQATYKLRGQEFYFRGKRAFPSYLQAGPSYFIEKSKRQMIAEDIAAALALLFPSA